MLIDRFINFEEVAEAESTNGPKGHTEEKQVAEI